MITVRIPNNYIPERTYAVKTLLSHFCGIEIDVIIDDQSEGYLLQWENKTICIVDGFFGKIPLEESFLQPTHLPNKIIQSQSIGLDNILIIYGQEKIEIAREKILCHVDIFAGTFFMLTRWEESISSIIDAHDRFPAREAFVVKEGFILRPIVDEYVKLLKHWLESFGYPVPKSTTFFRIIPTCDVDIPYFWSSKSLWKILGGRLKKHLNPFKVYKDYRNFKLVKANKKTDPYDTFDYMMSLAENYDNRFQFNFISGGKTKYEGYYQIGAQHISALIDKIKSRGHYFGMHPSYATYKDAALIKKEKDLLETHTGISMTKSRQHFLRFAVPESWRHLSDAGITEDSTLGYAAEPGFRCGTCKSYPVFDIHQRKELPLLERPLLIMDVSLRFYKKLSIAESIALCEKIKSEVKKHHGEFVFIWHNSTLGEIGEWEKWKVVLENLMK